MSEILKILSENLIVFIDKFGYLGVFLLMTLESALIPIPSEVTMTFAGFLAGIGKMNFWLSVFLGALGNLIGSLIAYWLGYKKGEEWIRFAIKKWGKWLLLSEHDFEKSKIWFEKYGQGISFGSRLLPIVRTFISLPAGIAKMNLKLFSFLTFLGSFLWSLFLCYLGLKLGQNWQAVEPYFRKFQYLIVALFVVLVVLYLYKHLKKKN